MYIITVNPLSKGIFKENLTYYSPQKPQLGSIVIVPVRQKEITALVVEVTSARNLKSSLKQADFKLKKIIRDTKKQLFLPTFLESAQLTAKHFSANLGQTLKTFTPQVILDNPEEALDNNLSPKNDDFNPDTEPQEIQVIQEVNSIRLGLYKGLIREAFAKDQSVFLLLPTTTDIDKVLPVVEKGISDYIYILHGKLEKKELLKRWQKALQEKHPILIIGTPICLSLPRQDLALFIVEQENSPTYKAFNRPFIDTRTLISYLNKTTHNQIILGDQVLRTETIYAAGQGDMAPINNLKFRFISEAKHHLIDLSKDLSLPESNKSGNKVETNIISKDLEELIQINQADSENMVIIIGQRGLSPVIFCQDCQQSVTCPHCQAPAVLHQKNKQRYFLCHKCGRMAEPEDKCPNCGSWRLIGLGDGVEKLEKEIKQLKQKYWRIDSDTTTGKQAKEIIKEFENTPGSILIGTEMILYYLTETLDNAAILGIDSLFSRPDFRISEKILNLLITLRSLALKRFIIQTANPKEKVFNHVLNGNLLDFFRDEIAERQKFGYPPFKTLIKISRIGEKKKVEAQMKWLADKLTDYQPIVYPAIIPIIKGKFHLNILIKLKPKDWPAENLLTILQSLPPEFIVNIDPQEILS